MNGEPIYARDVLAGLPKDSFNTAASDAADLKLERLINQTILRQFLNAKRLTVRENEVDKAIGVLRKYPPGMGYACCTYPSLESFMQASGYTLKELKQDIEAKLILEQYVDRLWELQYSSEETRKKLIGERRKQAEKYYARVWHIFFNTIQKPEYRADPAKVNDEMRTKAEAAWKRLQNGEPFADIAKQISEDQSSRNKGGELGLTSKYAFGPGFADALSRLKPDQYDKPFKSAYGYHIAKVEPLKDTDILEIAKMEFEDENCQKVLSKLQKQAKTVMTEKPAKAKR